MVRIEAPGGVRRLGFTFAVICPLERAFGLPFVHLLERVLPGFGPDHPLQLRDLLTVLAEGLDVTAAAAGEVVDTIGVQAALQWIADAFVDAFAAARSAEDDDDGAEAADERPESREPVPVDRDKLLRAWCHAGYDPEAFARVTPRQFNAAISGYRDRLKHEQQARAWLAWHTGACQRFTPMPSLAALTGGVKANGAPRKQSDAELRGAVLAWKTILNPGAAPGA